MKSALFGTTMQWVAQTEREVKLALPLDDATNASHVVVTARPRALRVQTTPTAAPLDTDLPKACAPDRTHWEVDERARPRLLRVTLAKEVAGEVWPWPHQDEPAAGDVKVDAADWWERAVALHALALQRGWAWLCAVPTVEQFWFSYIVYAVYAFVALAYVNDVWLDTSRRWSVALFAFQKALGLVYVAAWLSTLAQMRGLMGERGIAPLKDALAARPGPNLWTWLALEPTNRSLYAHVAAGLAGAVLFALNVLPSVSMAVSVVCYMSVRNCGSVFYQLQFDSLLLEAGWLACAAYASPVHWVRHSFDGSGAAPRTALLLCWWLAFRVLFSSGVVKLTSRDPAWASCSALDFHYWSQPLPTWMGYYWYHMFGARFHRLSCWLHFCFELVTPFCFFVAPLRVPVGLVTALGLQMLIAFTGNYGFFNWLTATLSLTLIDDAWCPSLAAWVQGSSSRDGGGRDVLLGIASLVWTPVTLGAVTLMGAAIVLASVEPMVSLARGRAALTKPLELLTNGQLSVQRAAALVPEWLVRAGLALPADEPSVSLHSLYRVLARYCVLNSYGLFAVMTTTRVEVVVYGSQDGVEWRAYDLYHKPGENLTRAPTLVPLGHLPRLDWRLWFCQFGRPQPWVEALCTRILQGEPDVMDLFRVVPWERPRFVKLSLYDYRFSSLAELRSTGAYWKRTYVGPYLQGTMTLHAVSKALMFVK